MGHDPNCVSWINTFRDSDPSARKFSENNKSRRRINKRQSSKNETKVTNISVLFQPSGKKGNFQPGL